VISAVINLIFYKLLAPAVRLIRFLIAASTSASASTIPTFFLLYLPPVVILDYKTVGFKTFIK
jgi:hypothetical protein